MGRGMVREGEEMKWSSKLPNRAGYYWYIGPVLKRDFDRVANGSDIRDCTWGPIIAGVGICLKEIPSGDGNIHHEKMWEEGRIVVEFYGSTVRRTLAEIPKDVFWAGPIAPPISDWAWHLQPKNKVQAKPFESEIDASEMTAWSEACQSAEGYYNPYDRDEYPDGSTSCNDYRRRTFCSTMVSAV